jgi:outer membrane receptor protein involved in Fe transport
MSTLSRARGRLIGALAFLVAGEALAQGAAEAKPENSPPAEPLRASELVVVTASRTPQSEVDAPPSLVVVTARDLDASAAPTLDDALRLVPGFNLFRRTGSRVANPTSQGVSLRGLGPSGASRALVLVDGLPLNDPFGGWVYWGRVPGESIDQVEVLRGGASDLYGSAALGGVIQVLTRPSAAQPDLSVEASLGNEATREGSLSAGGRVGEWGGRISAGGLETDGYVLVDEKQRGPVDTAASARYATADLTVDRSIPGGRAFVRGRFYGESRRNGTPRQTNRTHVQQVVVGADFGGPRLGRASVRLHASDQVFNQSFSAVADDRESEALIREQRVPAQDAGLSAQWSRPLGARHTLVAGLVGREVRGASDEVVISSGITTSTVGAGGRERTESVFVEDILRLRSRVQLVLGARFDHWHRSRALSTTTPLARPGPAVVTEFADERQSSLNPRATFLVNATRHLDLSLAGYHSFRGPTLNELYRSFRVGNTVTLANPNLRAERLNGGEMGVRWRDSRVTLASTAFWTETKDPVANLTLTATPSLITRQRENLGRTRARGLELQADARLGERFRLGAGYAFTDGVVSSFPPSPDLEGKILPQLPRHQASLQLRYERPRLSASVDLRAVSRQYEDDRNALGLASFVVADLTAACRVGGSAEVFAAIENLFDERYVAGLTPVATLGQPRLARAGLRLRLGRDRHPGRQGRDGHP